MNLFEQSADFLVGQLQNVAGRRCLYVRVKGSEQWNLTAPMSQRLYQVFDGGELATNVEAYDWIVSVADLPVRPRQGDVIIDLDTQNEYTVCPLTPEPAARPFDSQGVSWLVHSKLTEEADE